MNKKTEIELKNFFIFNSSLSLKEGEELKKILFYHPITEHSEVQIKNVGLVEGIIQFTNTFKPNAPVNSLHTQKVRQLYYQPEKDFWFVMTLTLPTIIKGKDVSPQVDYLDDEVQDNVYEAVLKESYLTFRLFWNTFEDSLLNNDIGILKTRLEHFYKSYLKSLKLQHSDLLNIFGGIQYLPLDKLTFMKVQCFINSLESTYDQIEYTVFLYNDHLIWSGLEPDDMKVLYQYLIGTLLPINMETELQGGSMPRNSGSQFAALHYGRFITGPVNLKTAKEVGKIPKVYLFASGKVTSFNLVVYRALSASVCLFIKTGHELTLDNFKEFDHFIGPKLTNLVADVSDYCSKLNQTQNLTETSPRFIYFNQLNLAYKSTVHLDNKQTGNVFSKEALKIMADLKEKKADLGHSSEIIVKTFNDFWIIVKSSNSREFYVALQQKNASLIDISEEVKKLCDVEFKEIFFQQI